MPKWSVNLLLPVLLGFVSNSYAIEDTVVVWSEPVGDDFEIFGSFRQDTDWSKAVRLVWATEPDILACAMPVDDVKTSASTEARSALVVWTRMISFEESYLTWLVWTEGAVPAEPFTFETGFEINTGVSMVKDSSGTIWLGWSAFDGVDDEIFVSRWTDRQWSDPVQVNSADELPDIKPNMGLSEDGRPWLSWLGLGDNGYERYFSRYDGVDWVEEVVLPEPKARDFEKLLGQRLDSLPTLPAHVEQPARACITHLDGHMVQTLRFPEPKPDASDTEN